MNTKKIINWLLGLKPLITGQETKQPKKRIKVRVKAGSEEWLRIASDLDRDSYYTKLSQTTKIKNVITLTKRYDDNNKRILKFDLVPKLQSNRNVRTYLEYTTGNFHKWSEIRKAEELKSNGVCVYCGNGSQELGVNHKTECHEVWEYIYKTRTQKLVRLEPVCIVCHKIKHLNQQSKNADEFSSLIELYSIINEISIDQAMQDYDKALNYKISIDEIRFKYLDLSILEVYNINEDSFNCHSPEFNEFIETFKRKNGNTD